MDITPVLRDLFYSSSVADLFTFVKRTYHSEKDRFTPDMIIVIGERINIP